MLDLEIHQPLRDVPRSSRTMSSWAPFSTSSASAILTLAIVVSFRGTLLCKNNLRRGPRWPPSILRGGRGHTPRPETRSPPRLIYLAEDYRSPLGMADDRARAPVCRVPNVLPRHTLVSRSVTTPETGQSVVGIGGSTASRAVRRSRHAAARASAVRNIREGTGLSRIVSNLKVRRRSCDHRAFTTPRSRTDESSQRRRP